MNNLPKTEEDWRKVLTSEQYRILREKGTDTPFSGEYVDNHEDGMYYCAACGNPLFDSKTKFESHSGWPSFYDVATQGNVILNKDGSAGMARIEVTCAKCGSHLGHLFDDGPKETTGQRYCINSTSLKFQPKDKE
jgi:peptide-methionine (R)-S-oxide reductase